MKNLVKTKNHFELFLDINITDTFNLSIIIIISFIIENVSK